MTNARLATWTTAALMGLLTSLPASAQEQTFHACYVPNVGAIYLIGVDGLPSECLATGHVQISWSEGQAGITDHGELAGLADDDHPEYVREGEAAAGDLSGTFPEPMVAALRGRALSSTEPTDGQVLVWNATDGVWEPRTSDAGITDHGELAGLADDDHPEYVREGEAAGGDLSGTFPDPAVVALQGNALATTAPVDAQVLTWNATDDQWQPQAAPSGVTDHGDLTGLADDDHPEYVRTGEAASGDLGGTFPGPLVSGLQGNAVSSTTPSDGQVLAWNAGSSQWGPGESDHGLSTGLLDDDHPQYMLADGVRSTTDGFAVTSSSNTGSIPVEGAGRRVMWYAGKAAFRAGVVTGAAWDDGNVGHYSTALGLNATANGSSATAMGSGTTASGSYSTSTGRGTQASGPYSTAMGHSSDASGNVATAIGHNTHAGGFASTALGSNTNAHVHYSTAMGYSANAGGWASTAMGNSTEAQAYASLVIGQYNVVEGTVNSWVDTEPLFVAGNGTSTTPSNALTLFKNGNTTIAGTLTESSDRRLKLGIAPLGSTLDALRDLRPVRFRFRPDTGHPTDPQIGLIAQDVAEAFPELVTSDAEGYLSLAYPKLTAVLVRAIQEQQDLIDAQRSALEHERATIRQQQEALERQQMILTDLEARLRELERDVRRQ